MLLTLLLVLVASIAVTAQRPLQLTESDTIAIAKQIDEGRDLMAAYQWDSACVTLSSGLRRSRLAHYHTGEIIALSGLVIVSR